MRPSARTLFVLTALLSLPFAFFLLWTEIDLRPRLEEQARTALEQQVRLISAAIEGEAFSDALADRLGRSAGVRVTLIAPDGTVLGDSEVSADRLPTVENHGDRPEVLAALRGEVGSSTRASETVSLRLLYVGIAGSQGVVRVSVPLAHVDALVTRSRQWVLAGGIIGLLLLFLIGGRIGRFWLRPAYQVQETLAAIAEGDYSRRVQPARGGAVGLVGRSVNEMAAKLEQRIGSLTQEREDLEALVEELEDGVALVDRDGIIVRANPAFERRTGRRGVIGEPIGSLLRDPANSAIVRQAIGGRAGANESGFGMRTILLEAQPYGGGALVVLRDLTRTRRLEQVRRDFVANVSHELKTPLTNIRGFGEAIADASSDRIGEFADRILVNVTRMQLLVDDLLELSRVESGVWRPELAAIELRVVAEDTWEALRLVPDEKGVQLELDLPRDFSVHVDSNAIRQILRNLFDNAIRYAPADSAIVLRGRRESGDDRIEVHDEGPGIPEEHRERVFERFYRVDTARSRDAGGTGLGLAIVKHLVAAHGGAVGVESEVGRGTTVWLTLPTA